MEFKRNTRRLRAISMISLIDIVFTIILPVLLWRSFQHPHDDEEE